MSSNVERALELATEAHEGQKRWDGSPYINHPIAVADQFDDVERKTVALLHDVLEDTDGYASRILSLFGPGIYGTLVNLTRYKSQSYLNYILGMKHDSIAVAVKLADIHHNLQGNDRKHLRDKYIMARYILTGGEIK